DGQYILPGGLVTVPATYNSLITTKASIQTRLLKTFTQSRFTTNSIHRYKLKTARRTEQTGFFAGLRDIKAFKVDYRKAVDVESYFVERYNPDDFATAENIEFYPETGASLIDKWIKPVPVDVAENLWRGSKLSEDRSALTTNAWSDGGKQVADGLEVTITSEGTGSQSPAY